MQAEKQNYVLFDANSQALVSSSEAPAGEVGATPVAESDGEETDINRYIPAIKVDLGH